MTLTKEEIAQWFNGLQGRICAALEAEDGIGRFQADEWVREAGGGGVSKVLSGGDVIEKGGVNWSAVHGPLPEMLKREAHLENGEFFASGVSIVIHPMSPMVPTTHMNVRYFEMSDGTCWFGGGIDLTPYYVDEDEARTFHRRLKEVCDRHDPAYFPRFKQWADEYFYLPHRKETRGIGGIFFDHLKPDEQRSKQELFAFVQEVGELFAPLYCSIMKGKKSLAYTEDQKRWQLIRRGRYVEFNLVYDRGTKFGLETDGRTESILMSLPEHASWYYDHRPEPGSAEEKSLYYFRNRVDWV